MSMPAGTRISESPVITAMTIPPQWESHSQSLQFSLGDYCLWRFHFQARVADAPLTCYLDSPNLLQDLVPATVETAMPYVIRSCPAPLSLPRLTFAGKYFRYVPVQYPRYYVVFKGSFEEYLGKFSPKSRYNLARSVRKLAELGGGQVDWRQYRRPEEMADFYQRANEVSKRTYQEQLLHEGFTGHVGSHEQLRALAERDAVRGYALFTSGQPIAYVLCRSYGDSLLYEGVGYDPDYRTYSTGSVLLYLLLENMFAERAFRYLDFGEGDKWYKEFFSTDSARCARVYYFPIEPAIISAITLHTVFNALTDLLGRALATLGLRNKIRRFLRARALSGTEQ